MHQFQKSRVLFLKELEELVTKALTHSHGERDERRQNRKLKAMRKELGKWKKELESEEKLRKQSRDHSESERKRVEEYYASDPSNRSQ